MVLVKKMSVTCFTGRARVAIAVVLAALLVVTLIVPEPAQAQLGIGASRHSRICGKKSCTQSR
jgi:hypothetical protein